MLPFMLIVLVTMNAMMIMATAMMMIMNVAACVVNYRRATARLPSISCQTLLL